MIMKIWLPKYFWDSITETDEYKETPNSIEIILRARFVPHIKEFSENYKKGNVEWMKNYYKFVLHGKQCFLSDDFITEVYELLEKENLFLETKEIEYLLSYSIMVIFAEEHKEFYSDSLPDDGNTS